MPRSGIQGSRHADLTSGERTLPNPLVRWRRSIGTENHVSKNYAVGLEISCPGGAYYWAPEIPGSKRLAGATPSTCELAHNRGSVLSEMAQAQIHTVGVRNPLGQGYWQDIPAAMSPQKPRLRR